MNSLFQPEETDAVLLGGCVKCIQLTKSSCRPSQYQDCLPSGSYICNQYLSSISATICNGGKELVSAEGTTQGDPLAMCLYALSLQQLISRLQAVSQAKQCWFADDATGCGSIQNIKVWWDELIVAGTDLGYHPNAGKCWLVTKPDMEETARSIFQETAINITTEGRKHLGAKLGSRSCLEQYVNGKVVEWVGQVTKLAEFALSQPQACYAAFTYGLKHRWTYFLRILPD